MNISAFTDLALRELQNPPPEAIIQIPSGSGIFHVANISPNCWISGFVSPREGRWKFEGEHKKHFASTLETCCLELYGKETPPANEQVCEYWETTASFPALNINAFSPQLREAFYEDFGNPPGKWAKANLFTKLYAESSLGGNASSIIAPSASGVQVGSPGTIFLGDPSSLPIKLLSTGTYGDFIQV